MRSTFTHRITLRNNLASSIKWGAVLTLILSLILGIALSSNGSQTTAPTRMGNPPATQVSIANGLNQIAEMPHN